MSSVTKTCEAIIELFNTLSRIIFDNSFRGYDSRALFPFVWLRISPF